MNYLKISFVFLILLMINCAGAASSDVEIEKRVKNLIAQMTLEEKIDYIGGYEKFHIRGIERLGIPQITMADGPVGCRNYGQSTAYPATIALAATWNRQLADEFGKAIARDSRARGVHILLMPGVNIYRSPLCGRNFEYMGEDPYLTSEIAVATVKALQTQGVMATVKHYACNNQEYDRHKISSDVDERTLYEIYLPAFKKVVQEGKVGGVMAAYNPVNGIHCTQNNYLNNKILKEEWGFDGILMSDWEATYDGIAAANGGLDLEMPSGSFMNKKTLLPAIQAGTVDIKIIDDKVARILRTLMRIGFFDRLQEDKTIPLNDPESSKTALELARQGIVLLRNNDDTLPLNSDEIKSIAILGPNADMKNYAYGGGGSSFTKPFDLINVIDAVKAQANGKFEILTPKEYNDDNDFNFNDVDIVGGQFDCKIYKYEAAYRENEPINEQIAHKRYNEISFSAAERNFEITDKPFTAVWHGTIKPLKSGVYGLKAQVRSRIRYLLVNNEKIRKFGSQSARVDLFLEKGKAYEIEFCSVSFPADKDKWVLRVGLDFITDFNSYADVEAMKKADAVLLCVGFNPDVEYERNDRPYNLPLLQAMLIKKANELNKKTIVIANAGGSFATENWIDNTNVLIHSWYPGQNGATALAEIIFGMTNPSGKLPITFEKSLEDLPAYNSYYDTDGDKHVKYSEGIFVGYRGFEKNKIKPLFPFGYGLSYTQFKYSDLQITPTTIKAGKEVAISAVIENIGKRAGAEVVQLYVSDINSSLPRPVKELKGFEKILLNPGEKKIVKFKITSDDLAFYSVEKKQWITEPGEFKILVGSSLEDIRLARKLEFRE